MRTMIRFSWAKAVLELINGNTKTGMVKSFRARFERDTPPESLDPIDSIC
jgi:hypothetical protein